MFSYFSNNGSQNYLIFQQTFDIFARPTGDTELFVEWKSKELSIESIKPPVTPSNSLASKLIACN